MLDIFKALFKFFVTFSITITSITSPVVIAPPSENLNFDVLKYPKEAVKTLEERGVTEEELKSRAFPDGDLHETNTINVTVENCNFRKLNSSKNSKLMFETDEFANVTYK